MNKTDTIIVGGGLAGLVAAAAAAKHGKKVCLLTKGVGAIAIGSGSIDLLGYGPGGQPQASPAPGLTKLSDEHPYTKIGFPVVKAALDFFLELAADENFPYAGSLSANQWLPTAVGTLKPACLVPQTMNPASLHSAAEVTVIGFTGLKDYYPGLIARELKKQPGCDKAYTVITVDSGLATGRDLSALDIARWLEKEEGRQNCINQLRGKLAPGSVALIPPVLGTNPDYRVHQELTKATGCDFIETAGLPPAVTGLRLRTMLTRYIKKRGGEIIEQAHVSGALVEDGRCKAVFTTNVDRKRYYHAESFILATGGFFGGGLKSGPGFANETIFNFPVTVPADQAKWTECTLFAETGQPFARFGLSVDENLRPVDHTGRLLLENVHVAGRTLAGYDPYLEKSGNGVALASGYHAAMSL